MSSKEQLWIILITMIPFIYKYHFDYWSIWINQRPVFTSRSLKQNFMLLVEFFIREELIFIYQPVNHFIAIELLPSYMNTGRKWKFKKFTLEACPKLHSLQFIFKIKLKKRFLQSMPCGYSKLKCSAICVNITIFESWILYERW